MTKKNLLDFESEEVRNKKLQEIISFFQDERGERIGLIAADAILNFFLQTFGEDIYKKGIRDCQRLIKEKAEDLEVELDILVAKN